mmetsp:Transcript_11857/g.16078  ORF Transcript_11857/g.16078 Transcript_11857/m.16078 type:complete len:358 (+) Transcript_11857:85-1158(+)
MMLKCVLLSCVFPAVISAVVPAVTEVNLTQYIGRWYQMSADRVVMSTFERNSVCVLADYALDQDDTYGEIVRLVNSASTSQGEGTNVTGFAFIADATNPGELSVKFDPPVPQFLGSYWIIKLGPIYNGIYDYAIVSDDKSQTLFVLARCPMRYSELYADEVDSFLQDNGFTGFLYAPIATNQANCTYPDFPFLTHEIKQIKKTSDYCPSSSAMIHASCDETITFSNTCDQVRTEIVARIKGQYNVWYDPHNNGTYTILSDDSDELQLQRTTGNGKYTDLINFIFDDTSSSCSVSACSESQVTSIVDFGTNHCNIFVLFCGSNDNCAYVQNDLDYTESINKCSDSTTSCFENNFAVTA